MTIITIITVITVITVNYYSIHLGGGRLAELGDTVAHPLLLGADGYNYSCKLF